MRTEIKNLDVINLIDFFNVALDNKYLKKSELLTPAGESYVRKKAMQLGYIVLPGAINSYTRDFLDLKHIDTTATFYKTWESVESKNRFELLIDQLTHYAIAYIAGETWTPEESVEDYSQIIQFDSYKVIAPCTPKEMMTNCVKMLTSGIALKSDIVKSMVRYLVSYTENYDVTFTVPVDEFVNKEAKIVYYDMTDTWPSKGEEIVRYLCYKATGAPMVIKNKDVMNCINSWAEGRNLSFTDEQMKELARVFFRFKPLILAMKNSYPSNANHIVNRIRKMANKYHKPMNPDFWGNLLAQDNIYLKDYSLLNVRNKSAELNNFRLISLIQAVDERLDLQRNGGPEFYRIRNGKAFIHNRDLNIQHDTEYAEYLMDIHQVLVERLKDNLKSKACIVKFPKDLNLACPTSQKNFIGELPFGTYYKLSNKNAIFGIYWKNEWGTRDFDLSFMGFDGSRIGWNSGFYNDNHSVVFSGDMVNADPEAVELMYCKSGCPDGLIYNNRFNGEEGSQFRFFTAIENISSKLEAQNGYRRPDSTKMVNPGNIKVSAMMTSTKRETQVGVILNSKLYFVQLDLRNTRTANRASVDDFKKIYLRKTKNYLYVKDLLLAAGFKDYDKINKDVTDEELITPYDLDLTNCSKATLIELFS